MFPSFLMPQTHRTQESTPSQITMVELRSEGRRCPALIREAEIPRRWTKLLLLDALVFCVASVWLHFQKAQSRRSESNTAQSWRTEKGWLGNEHNETSHRDSGHRSCQKSKHGGHQQQKTFRKSSENHTKALVPIHVPECAMANLCRQMASQRLETRD